MKLSGGQDPVKLKKLSVVCCGPRTLGRKVSNQLPPIGIGPSSAKSGLLLDIRSPGYVKDQAHPEMDICDAEPRGTLPKLMSGGGITVGVSEPTRLTA